MDEVATKEKRRHARTDLLKGSRVSWQLGEDRFTSRLSDLGLGGLFIEATEPPPVGTIIDLVFEGPGKEIRARAAVRRAVPGQGMGVEFVTIGSDDQARLRELLKSADQSKPRRTAAADPVKEEIAPSAPRANPAQTAAAIHKAKPEADARPDKDPERRAHLRHKVAALVEFTEESGKRAKGLLSNLGEQGCYVKTENTHAVGTALVVTITKGPESLHAQARVVYCLPAKGMGLLFTSVGPADSEVLESWLGASLELSWLAANRRRGQRIALTIHVQVAGVNNLGTRFTEDTSTLTISPHGALVLLTTTLNKGQRITLSNLRTRAAVECAVVYVAQGKGKEREVGLSFALPNRAFWKVAFPPADWSPHHSDAKRTGSG
jgi:hypothetical protein